MNRMSVMISEPSKPLSPMAWGRIARTATAAIPATSAPRPLKRISARKTRCRGVLGAGDERFSRRGPRQEIPDGENDERADPNDPEALGGNEDAHDVDRPLPREGPQGIGLAAPYHQCQALDRGEQAGR